MSESPFEVYTPPLPEGVAEFAHIPFDHITPELVAAKVDTAMRLSEELIDQVVADESLSYDSVLAPLVEVSDLDGLADEAVCFMVRVHPDKSVREAVNEASKKLSRNQDERAFRTDLYDVVKAYSETNEARELTGEKQRFLGVLMRNFRHAGHELDESDTASRERLKELKGRVSDNIHDYLKNLNEDDTIVSLSREELDGLPGDYVQRLKRDDDGNHIVTLSAPDYLPIQTLATNRNVRERMKIAFKSLQMEANKPLLQQIADDRLEIANILGYPSWAHLKLEDRMLKTPEEIYAFYDKITTPLQEKSRVEVAVMTEMLHADGYEGPLQSHDVEYYTNRLKERDYGVDSEKVAEYFPLEQCLNIFFDLTGPFLGVAYREVDESSWHPDVRVFAIDDIESGEEIAKFHMDLHPRPRQGKSSGAAAGSMIRGRELPDGSYRHPVGVTYANFTEPTPEKPALLKHAEVTTQFHEMAGHLLHACLTRAKLSEFAGENASMDFVEVPSQLAENWLWEPEILKRYARHYQTGKPMPQEMIDGLVASRDLNVATLALRQIHLGMFDMAVHDDQKNKDIDTIWEESNAIEIVPQPKGSFMPASFFHIVSSGYDAGYNVYQVALVGAKDLYYGRIQPEGLNNPLTGRDYRQMILEKGGTEDGIDMMRAFLDREPSSEAYLRSMGIEIEPGKE